MLENEKPVQVPQDLLKTHEAHERRFLQVGDNANFVHQYYTVAEAQEDMLGIDIPRDAEELNALTNRLLSELDAYGIPRAFVSAVPMTKEGEPAVFITAHSITPTSTLDRAEFGKFIEAQCDVWNKLLEYFEDKARTNDAFLWDIPSTQQYVWGKKEGDAESRLYLVDVQPRASNKPQDLAKVLEGMAREMSKIGARLVLHGAPDIALLEARAKALAQRLRSAAEGF